MHEGHHDVEQFFALSLDMLCIAGFDGFFKRLNPIWESTLGLTREELMAAPFVSFIHPDDREATIAATKDLALGNTIVSFMNRYRCKDGSYRLFEWTAGSSVERQHIHAIARDMTERRRAEARTRHLLSSSPVVLYAGAWRGERAVTFVSDNVLGQFGYGPKEFEDDPRFWADRIHPEDAPRVFALLESITEGDRASCEYRFLHKSGEYRWVRDEIKLARDHHGNPIEIVGSRQDVTERRQADEIIRKQAVALLEVSTPLIPISDDVLVMPLIGMMDTTRARQVLDTLLDGIARSKARIAIIDITGVGVVDTQVANALITAARAVQLLGSEVVLTGIRPEVARTLVGLGADLSSIITRSTLQAGIQYAVRGEVAHHAWRAPDPREPLYERR